MEDGFGAVGSSDVGKESSGLKDVINHSTTRPGRSKLSVDISRSRMLGMLRNVNGLVREYPKGSGHRKFKVKLVREGPAYIRVPESEILSNSGQNVGLLLTVCFDNK